LPIVHRSPRPDKLTPGLSEKPRPEALGSRRTCRCDDYRTRQRRLHDERSRPHRGVHPQATDRGAGHQVSEPAHRHHHAAPAAVILSGRQVPTGQS
jgi:hypothetical protein